MKRKKLSIAKFKTLFVTATHKVKLRTWIAVWILLICIPVIAVLLYKPIPSKAAWFNNNWRYRVAISIPSHSSSEDNVYVTPPTFNATDTNKFQSDCGDLRFTKENGQLLKYYVVDCDSTANIHVFFDTLPAGASTYYMYYGNASAPNGFQASDFSTAASGLGTQTSGSEEITSGPVAFWLFDEGQGTTSYDGTQGGNNASLTSTTWTQSPDQCHENKCLYYNGSASTATVTNHNIIDFDTGLAHFTFGAWVKVNSDGENNVGRIISKGTNTYMRVTNEGADRKVDLEASLDLATSDATVSVTDGLTLNEWHYVSMAYTNDSDDEISVYIDGKLRGTSTNGNGSPATDTNNLSFGGITNAHFHGFIDSVRVYAYERDSNEMKVDATGGSVVSAPNTGTLGEGLIAHWKFDETSWTNDCSTTSVIDSSGNGHNARSCPNGSGITTLESGRLGNAAPFDNNNDYLEVPSTIDLANKSFTLAAWVYRDANVEYAKIFTQGAANTNEGLHFGYNGDDTIRFGFWGNDLTSLGNQAENNVWTHLVGTYNAETNERKIYENGLMIAEDIASADFQGSGNFTIGEFWVGFPYGSEVFNGKIDDARVYGRALIPDEVSQLYSLSGEPIAHWKLDENTGTTANDSSGNGNTGTLTNSPAWVPGKYGSALSFSDLNRYVDAGTNSILNMGSNDFTLSAWIKTTSTVGTGVAAGKGGVNTGGKRYSIAMSLGDCGTAGKFKVEIDDDTTKKFACSINDLNDGNWHHIIGIRNGNNLLLYVDGALNDTEDITGYGNIDSSRPFTIGSLYDETGATQAQFFPGTVDDVKVYRHTLTPQEIIQDMNAGHPVGGSPIGSQNLYWKFDEGQGTTANAAVSGTPNGTLTSIASPATSTSGWTYSGKYNNAITFDGSNDKVVLATASDANVDFNGSEAFTLSAWIYMTTAPGASDEDLIIGKWDETNSQRAYRLYIDNDDGDSTAHIAAYVFDESADESMPIQTENDTIATNTWYHVLFTYDGTNTINSMNIYLNGRLAATSPLDTFFVGIDDVTSDFTVGDYDVDDTATNNTAFTGIIDDVQVYNFELTAEQVPLITNANAAISVSSGSDEADTIIDGSGNPPSFYWPLDEYTGTTVRDTSGNAINGTMTNGPVWVNGKVGQGIDFDDSDDYITFGNGALNPTLSGASAITIQAWLRPDTITSAARNRVINYYVDGTNTGGMININASGNIEVGGRSVTGDSFQSLAGSAASLGNWYFVSGILDFANDTITLYINGEKTSSSVTFGNSTYTTGTPTLFDGIGSSGNPAEYFGGIIDDVKIYKYARTGAQIAYDYNRGAPVGWWKFDENQGTTIYDASGNSSTGTLNGSGTPVWTTGKYNTAIDFPANSDCSHVDMTNESLFDLTNAITVSAWIKSEGFQDAWEAIVTKGDSAWRLTRYNSTNNVGFSTTGLSNVDLQGTKNINDGNWHHIVGVYNGTTKYIYVDGKLDTSTAATGSISTNNYNVSVSENLEVIGRCFNGTIDDVRIYNYAFSATQIRTLYNENSVLRFGPSEGSP
jgi:hypothetical protein